MTIDSTFIACFKEEVPEAFTPAQPFEPQAVFIDGQIKLMCPLVHDTITWEDYIDRQFARPLARHFARGVGTVILAFDDYEYVPKAKSMTQLARRRNVPTIEMHDRDTLPAVVPKGERWTQCIANRTFKSKVIQLVLFRLTSSLGTLMTNPAKRMHQFLIIDYQGHPVRHRIDGDPVALVDFAPLGEADVKFPRYTKMYKRLQVDSVDGDSIPIALLHYEKGFDGQISIYRMTTRVGTIVDSHRSTATTGRKRKLSTTTAASSDFSAAPTPPPKAKREYEYVDMELLYSTLRRNTIPQCQDRINTPSHVGHEMSILVSVIGLAGTDFTRGLPQVTGKTLFEYIPYLWAQLCAAYIPSTGTLDPDRAADLVIAAVYKRKFERHVANTKLPGVLADIQRSKLSARTKACFPTVDTFRCTVRNVNWLLQYWREPQYPDPFQAQFGFVNVKGKVAFAA